MDLAETLYFADLLLLAASFTLFPALLLRSARGAQKTNLDFPNPSTPTVTIVIPTYNEAQVIERKLANISQFDFPQERLQVLVVDSASTDGTPGMVRRFAEQHREANVVLLERPVRLGKADAINEAIRHVKSDFFVLTDADVTSPKEALSLLLANFHDKGIGAASGVEIPVGQRTFAGRIESGYKAVYTGIRMGEAAVDTPFMCESEFSAYRTEALRPLRPGCMCDDIELTVALRSTGLKARYDSQSLFLEQEAGTLGSKLHHKLRRGMANQHAIVRNSSVLFNRTFGKYGTVVFPFEFLTHIISPVLVTLGLTLLLTLLIITPVTGLFAAILSVLAALPPLAILRVLTKRYGTDRMMGLEGRWDWVAGALAFLAFQVALLASLLQLAIQGPRLKWEKISETRAASSAEEPILEPMKTNLHEPVRHPYEPSNPRPRES